MVDFWCRFFFFTVWCRFFHGLRRFFTVCKGHKRWKKNISLSMSFFTVSFSRFAPPLDCFVYTVQMDAESLGRKLLVLRVCWPAREARTGNLWKCSPSALESALRNRGALGSAPESALEGALPVLLYLESTLGSTPESTPFSESTLESTREHFRRFPVRASLAGQQTRNAGEPLKNLQTARRPPPKKVI